MCRFVYYQGPPIYLSSLLTEPEHSLIHQSVHAHMREEPLNGDGFGVGCYQPVEGARQGNGQPRRDVGRFRSITPAWSNRNLEDLARVVRSPRILAHVRAASPGSIVSETNSHPFRSGPMLFMHNGHIGGFRQLRRALLDRLSDDAFGGVLGSTDSEHFFALLQDELRRSEGTDDRGSWMAEAFRSTLDTVLELREARAPDAHVHLNVVLTDGTQALVSRFTTDSPHRSQTLFVNRGGGYECRDGEGVMLEGAPGAGAVLVSSEPLNNDPGWEPVEPGSLLLIDEDAGVRTVPIRS